MELISISTIQTSRAGGWDPTVKVRDYLLGLPLKFMRCVAGFPKEPGQHHLPRATTEPPEVLGGSSRLWKSGGRKRSHQELSDLSGLGWSKETSKYSSRRR